jgi:hypothetical protein
MSHELTRSGGPRENSEKRVFSASRLLPRCSRPTQETPVCAMHPVASGIIRNLIYRRRPPERGRPRCGDRVASRWAGRRGASLMVRGRHSTPLDPITWFRALAPNASGIAEMGPPNAPPARTDCSTRGPTNTNSRQLLAPHLPQQSQFPEKQYICPLLSLKSLSRMCILVHCRNRSPLSTRHLVFVIPHIPQPAPSILAKQPPC